MLAYAFAIKSGPFKYGLEVHGLPERTGFDIVFEESVTEFFAVEALVLFGMDEDGGLAY